VEAIFWMLRRGCGEEKSLAPLPGIEQLLLGVPARQSVATVTEISVFRGENKLEHPFFGIVFHSLVSESTV